MLQIPRDRGGPRYSEWRWFFVVRTHHAVAEQVRDVLVIVADLGIGYRAVASHGADSWPQTVSQTTTGTSVQ
jgi:hypothetical protein